MKRILSLFLILCMCFSTVFPISAFAVDTEAGFADSERAPDSGIAPIDEQTAQESDDDADCYTPQISPFSGFIGEDNEYYTRIRLNVTDNSGNPLPDAVYGLYTMGGQIVEYLVTDSYGVAVSGDVSVYTDYYLEEITPPEGFIQNAERRYIYLTEICAPSLVGVSVEYDPIIGRIIVIKTDEYGNPLSGVGFYVYRADTWELVDEIITGWDGTAVTVDLPYGWYELYEYLVPEDYESDGYYSAMIEADGETVELHIINYYNPPYILPDEAFVCVYKTGSDGRVIPGAVFSVYTIDGFWMEDIVTNSNGYAYSNSLPMGDYFIVEKSVPAEYILDDIPYYFTLSYSWDTVYIDIVNERVAEPGRVKIIKTDDSGNPLSDVVFGLYRAWDGALMQELVTSEGGAAESGLLNPGDYYLVELSGKDGYEFSSEPIYFAVDGNGEKTVTISVVNPKIRIFGKVQVIKQDDAGNPLSGVRFGLFCHKDNLLQELVTGADGTAVSSVLNMGDYYLVELEGLPGYVKDEQRYPFSITENSATVPITFINTRITGGIRVIKTSEDSDPLPDVVFGIYLGGALVEELTTDADGIAESGTLYYGIYELRELSTVEGYELLDVSVPFSILEDGEVIEIPITNPLICGGVRILKTDESGNSLSGAVFGLYNNQDQLIAELTTGADGTADIYNLVMGSYYLRELTAPLGYVPVDYDIPLNTTAQGEIFETTIINIVGCGTLRIIKTGEDDELLPGVVSKVYRSSDDILITEITTDSSGIAEAELPLGAYYLLETQTAEGYMLPEGSFSFSLTEHGAIIELSIQNKKEPESDPEPEDGSLKLMKLDEDTEEPLPGTVFGVYCVENGEKIDEITTGTDGMAVLTMPEGSYYLLELTAPSGYELKTDKISVVIKTGETIEITVYNTAISDVDTIGLLRITKKDSDTRAKLSGVVFGVYSASDDEKVAEIKTGSDGTVSYELDAGRYYLLELQALSGYKLNTEKTSFRIKTGKTTELTILNELKDEDAPITGNLYLIKKAEGTGAKLSGAVFGVYSVSGDKKISEITTGSDGTAVCELSPGDYHLRELKAPDGFILETVKIPFNIKADATVKVEVTNMCKLSSSTTDGGGTSAGSIPSDGISESAAGDDKSISSGGDNSTSVITVPKTGESLPIMNYLLSALFSGAAAISGRMLYKKRGKKTRKA